MDTRPYDSSNTINTRARIRLCSFLALLCVLFYIAIQENFITPHISYLHMFHIFVQPLVLFASLLDFSALPGALSYVHIAMFLVDAFVAGISLISVSRCFQESTATCFERVYEKGVWTALAGILCVLDLVIYLQLGLLNSQLTEKDKHEKAELTRLKNTGDAPSWNSITIFKKKSRVLNIFMVPLNVVYVICMMNMSENRPLYFMSLGHLFLDPFLLYVDLGREKTQFLVFRIVYCALLGLNILMMVIQLQLDINEISKMLPLLISMLYIVTDLNQIVYMSAISDTIEKYNQYKRSI